MHIHKRLLVVGLMLFLAALACSQEQQEAGDLPSIRQELDQAEGTLNANSAATEQALATARVEATATRAYFETQEALCVSLTREECASLGGYSYDVLAVGRDTGKCTYNDRLTEVWREITFENGQFRLVSYTGGDYDGHTRIAENTYQWVNPTGPTETVTFTMNGQIVVEESLSGDCIWDITYTFKE